MRIRILKSVKHDSSWIEPGTIMDMEDKNARRLILNKAAEELTDSIVDENDDEVSDNELKVIVDKLIEIDGVNNELAYRLVEAGYGDLESIANAEVKELVKIKGIGAKNAKIIIDSAEELLDE